MADTPLKPGDPVPAPFPRTEPPATPPVTNVPVYERQQLPKIPPITSG